MFELVKSFQENPYALENEEDVYESNGRFEPFSFLDSTLKVAEVVQSTLTLETNISDANPCSTPLGKIIKILAPEIVAIVNNMFTTMTLFPSRVFKCQIATLRKLFFLSFNTLVPTNIKMNP